jgi:hypothetical protein
MVHHHAEVSRWGSQCCNPLQRSGQQDNTRAFQLRKINGRFASLHSKNTPRTPSLGLNGDGTTSFSKSWEFSQCTGGRENVGRKAQSGLPREAPGVQADPRTTHIHTCTHTMAHTPWLGRVKAQLPSCLSSICRVGRKHKLQSRESSANV